MKFTKMSLVAALLIGSSAFAIENVKVSGDANLFYSTMDGVSGAQAVKNAINGTNDSGSLFSKDSSAADASLNLNVTADLVKNDLVAISAGAGYSVLSTLGLENNLVSNVWGSSHSATAETGATYGKVLGGVKVENASWVNEAWIAATSGKTTAKIGRMVLDTPLAFTETWSVEKNTFEGAVVINQNIPNTTLVGAYIGNGNGNETFGEDVDGTVAHYGLAMGGVVNEDGKFTTYGTDGAYAVGVINNSFKPLTVQAWYYNLPKLADAYWLQADLKCKKVKGLLVGAQYSSVKAAATGSNADSVYALMLGYQIKNIATIKAAYSSVNDDGSLGYAGFNTATSTGTAKSKLYTEAWWNYGQVTMKSTDTYHLSAEGKYKDIDLGLYYTYADHDKAVSSQDLTEYTATASKAFGPLKTTLAYINYNLGKNTDTVNMIQAYLTLKF